MPRHGAWLNTQTFAVNSTMTDIDPKALREMLFDGEEMALLDVREQGEFGQCHLYQAINAPLSRLELLVRDLVPRLTTRIAVTAADNAALAARGADALAGLGYTDLRIVTGGPAAWEDAWFTLYSGINVPSKAFGEAVEHHYGTPSVTAGQLKRMQDKGEDLVVLDSRTFAEYRNMNIPGGVSVPGGELAYRVRDFVGSDATTVVVNCAGRTRSIVGAQSVINSGIPNKVVALENGTMGWHLAGYELEHGRTDRFADGDPETIAAAHEMRDRVAADFGVETVDQARLAKWRDEADRRTLYLLDVRDPEEFVRGHFPGARSAPGGQLVQATDFQIGVPRGRIVLVDDTGVRATITAHWLVQMGYPEVYVLEGGPDAGLATDDGASEALPDVETLTPDELAAALSGGGATVLDVGESRAFRKSHVPGAVWAIRTRIAETGPGLPQGGSVVVTSDDGSLARLAVEEVRAITGGDVKVLDGGTSAWTAAGHPTEASPETPPDDACIDVFLRAYDRNTDVEAKMQEYIDWEVNLVNQIEADPDVNFRLGPVS